MKKKIIISIILILSVLLFSFEGENIMGIPMKYFSKPKKVVATIYKPYHNKNRTADGFKFGKHIDDTTKIIAVSRDLCKEYPFGSKVIVLGAGKLDGIYQVRDLMNKKWKHKIDILVNRKVKNIKFAKVQIMKISDDYFLCQ